MEKGLIFTYLLAYGGAVVSLFNPFIGLLIYFCFAIITPEAMWYWAVRPGNYSRIIAIALIIGWGARGFGNWNFRGAKPIVYSLVGFWVWAILGSQSAQVPQATWNFIEAFAKILLPVVVGMTLIDSLAKLKALAWVLMLSQGYVAYELNLSYINGFNRLSDIQASGSYAGLDNNSVCIAMVCGCGLAFFLGLRDNVLWRKWLCFFLAALMAHVPMFADSRGGMLALVITGVVSFFLMPKSPKLYLYFALAVIVGLQMAGPAVTARFMTVFAEKEERDRSASSRLEMWKDCVDVMSKNPVFGCGADNWPFIAPQYGWKRGKEAHTLWLQIGAETGVLGMWFLLSYYAKTVLGLWKLLRGSEMEPWLADAARMVIAALVGFGVAACFVSLEGLELPYYVALLGAGTIKLSSRYQSVRELVPSHSTSARLPAYSS